MANDADATAASSKGAGTEQNLTFELGNETYGVEILRVREIRGWTPVTRIPQAPPHVLGVLNLRGSIVPVIDLRMRFALERADYTKVTVIIVLSVHSCAGLREVGVVVDGVSDVVAVDSANIMQAPDLGTRMATEYIRGLVTLSDCDRIVVLLDIDRLIGSQLTSLPTGPEAQAHSAQAA
jgi:purine-binding chemotaxis protein CheW